MRKFVSIILAAVMLLSVLSGCQKETEAPETVETTMDMIVETTVTVPAEVPAETTVATEETIVNDTAFRAGTWMAQCGPVSCYWFFETDGDTGCVVDMENGSRVDFTYLQTDDQGVFSYADGADDACKVLVQDEAHITLERENQPPETLVFVSALGVDQFHFYTHEEIARMALWDYLAKNYPVDGDLQAAGMDNGDGTSTIQIYQNLGDHNSTAAYYIVDRCTGEGQNISNGTDVDLTKGTQDIDIFRRHPEFPVSPDTPYLVLNETEYAEQIVLHPLVTVTDFRVVSLAFVENGENYGFQVMEQLYEAASMGPETGVLLLMELPELIPNVGVIYKDRNGDEQFYAVVYSGLDGSAMLVKETLY